MEHSTGVVGIFSRNYAKAGLMDAWEKPEKQNQQSAPRVDFFKNAAICARTLKIAHLAPSRDERKLPASSYEELG